MDFGAKSLLFFPQKSHVAKVRRRRNVTGSWRVASLGEVLRTRGFALLDGVAVSLRGVLYWGRTPSMRRSAGREEHSELSPSLIGAKLLSPSRSLRDFRDVAFGTHNHSPLHFFIFHGRVSCQRFATERDLFFFSVFDAFFWSRKPRPAGRFLYQKSLYPLVRLK